MNALTEVTKPGGTLFLMCFSDKEPGTEGPRRIARDEIAAAFRTGWTVESISEARFEVRPDFTEIQFSEGGPYA